MYPRIRLSPVPKNSVVSSLPIWHKHPGSSLRRSRSFIQKDRFIVTPEFEPILKRLGLAPPTVFTDERIRPWRVIKERQNCILDFEDQGRPGRFHIKRFEPDGRSRTPAEQEAAGISLLERAGIPTVRLVGWGSLADGRSIIILEDLAGYQSAERLLAEGFQFERMSAALASFVANLHQTLHHRDLYLCHIFVRPDPLELRLIDAGRVGRLPPWPFRRRWIVKDLAQLSYSMSRLEIPDIEKNQLLSNYAKASGMKSVDALCRAVARKEARIARHDENLSRKSPERNVSLPC